MAGSRVKWGGRRLLGVPSRQPPCLTLLVPRGADANRRSGSAYRGLDARESSAKYIGQLRSISVQLIVVLLERYVLYLVALALTLVAAFVTRLRKVKLFTGLSEVVGADCDPARADEQLLDYDLLLRRPAERDVADAARMRERMMLATCHQQRAN